MSGDRYQDYVIKNGELIANFEKIYTEFSDPWNQSTKVQRESATRIITRFYIDKLREEFKSKSILEIGCGYAWLTEDLHNSGYRARGTDVSQACILKAKERNSKLDLHTANFLDERHLVDFKPNVIVMNQLSWYVLGNLREFVIALRKLAAFSEPTFLIHSLATYADGVQSYGNEFYTNREEIEKYFGLNYLFSMETETLDGDRASFDTMFVAQL